MAYYEDVCAFVCKNALADRLKRLEAEQRRIADEIAEVRKAQETPPPPPPAPKTRGEEVAEHMLVDFRGNYFYGCPAGISSFHPRNCLAAAIDAEIARAKQQQREKDADIAKLTGYGFCGESGYSKGFFDGGLKACRAIRDEK